MKGSKYFPNAMYMQVLHSYKNDYFGTLYDFLMKPVSFVAPITIFLKDVLARVPTLIIPKNRQFKEKNKYFLYYTFVQKFEQNRVSNFKSNYIKIT